MRLGQEARQNTHTQRLSKQSVMEKGRYTYLPTHLPTNLLIYPPAYVSIYTQNSIQEHLTPQHQAFKQASIKLWLVNALLGCFCMTDFCNTQNMQMKVPDTPMNRYALYNADGLFCFGRCNSVELRETTAVLSGTKETIWLSVTTSFIC